MNHVTSSVCMDEGMYQLPLLSSSYYQKRKKTTFNDQDDANRFTSMTLSNQDITLKILLKYKLFLIGRLLNFHLTSFSFDAIVLIGKEFIEDPNLFQAKTNFPFILRNFVILRSKPPISLFVRVPMK